VSQHPVTTEFEKADTQIAATLSALDEIAIPTLMLWPNSDAGHDHFNKLIRLWQKKSVSYPRRFFRNLPPEIYLRLMSLTSCLVGNSSSGLREGAFIGTPVVNIGSRQAGREKTINVKNVEPSVSEIVSAVKLQTKHGFYARSLLYGSANAGVNIAKVLGSSLQISLQKQLKF
jgi:UDP-N-acetylglucosamine 2-epimerase